MKHFLLFLLSIPLMGQAVVRSVETTNTQAVLRFTIPTGTTTCTVEVSEEIDYTPLVHDVNGSLFSGAANCTRPTSIVNGNASATEQAVPSRGGAIVFVAGRRVIDMLQVGNDRRGYSRALQAATKHYYRITTDGPVTATGTFETQTVPFGNTHTDPYIPDPDVPGSPKWLYYDVTARNHTVIDPHTGVQVRNIDNADDYRSGYGDGTGQTVLDGATWTDSANINSATPGTYTTCTGAGCGLLVFERALVNQSVLGAVRHKSLRFKVTGLSSEAGSNQIRICIVKAGSAPYVCDDSPHAYKVDLTLPNGSETEVSIPADTLFRGYPYTFPMYVGIGGHGWVRFGIEKISATGTVSLRLAKTGYEAYHVSGLGSSGAATRCNSNIRSDGTYLCVMMNGASDSNKFYLIHAETGNVTWIGRLAWLPDIGTSRCDLTHMPFHETNPNIFYCAPTSSQYYGEMTYAGPGTTQTADYNWVVNTDYTYRWITTPASLAGSLQAFYDANAAQWTSLLGGTGNFQPFSTSLFYSCNAFNYQAGYLVGQCRAGSQDSPSWMWAIDASDSSVAAMMPQYAVAPSRWCADHTPELMDVTDTVTGSTTKAFRMASALSGNIDASTTTLTLTSSCTGDCTGFHAGDPVAFEYQGVTYTTDSIMRIQVGDWLRLDSEIVKVTAAASSSSFTIVRAQQGTSAASHTSGISVYPICAAWTGSSQEIATNADGARTIWHFVADPYGTDLTGQNTLAVGYYGHPDFKFSYTLNRGGYSDNKFGWRSAVGTKFFDNVKAPTLLPEPYFNGRQDGISFGGVAGNNYGLCYQTHANMGNTKQSGIGAYSIFDAHPFAGCSYMGEGSTLISGTLYRFTPDSSTPIKPKHLPTFGVTHYQYLRDISGPGSVIDGSVSYGFCNVLIANECVSGSTPGQVYFTTSVPIVNVNGCFEGESYDGNSDVCITNMSWEGAGTSQVLTNLPTKKRYGIYGGLPDPHLNPALYPRSFGAEWVRLLTRHGAMHMFRGMSVFEHVKPTANGRYGLTGCYQIGLTCLIRIPPARLDGVNRAELQALPVSATGAHNVVVEFGYGEHYDPSEFRCTTRADKCIAHLATIDRADPFSYASETYSGVSCASGCTVTIPVYPTSVVYYRVVYRDAGNAVLRRGPMQVQAVF